MNRIVIRTIPKDKLHVIVQLPSFSKRFERAACESIEAFIKRLRKASNATSKAQIFVTDHSGLPIHESTKLSDALVPSNRLVFKEQYCSILVNPPMIDEVKVKDTPCVGLVLHSEIFLSNLLETEISYCWEAKNGTSDFDWTTVSTDNVLQLRRGLEGHLIRLSCSADGAETVKSNVIGPVKSDENTNKLLSRSIPMESGCTRIMSYNILADVFMRSKTTPIKYYYNYCPSECQAREYREPRIVAEVTSHNPQILCMQEVEDRTYRDSLIPMMPSYESHITVIKGRFKAGCALFFKKDAFDELLYESFPLPELYLPSSTETNLSNLASKMENLFPEVWKDISVRPVMTQISVLKNKQTGKLVIIGNTHLFWNPAYHIIALFHIHALCTKIRSVRLWCEEKFGEEDVRVILCGDLNSGSKSYVHAYLTQGTVEELEDGSELREFLTSHVTNPLKLQLARGEPNYTNYTEKFKDVIDYILCDSKTKVGQVTPSPPLSDLEKCAGCPSPIFPSDHLPIISDIILPS